jgi:hypothetical protein
LKTRYAIVSGVCGRSRVLQQIFATEKNKTMAADDGLTPPLPSGEGPPSKVLAT